MNISELLSGLDCQCGRRHDCAIKYIYIEKGATARLPEVLIDFSRVLIVADENTFGSAGDRTASALGERLYRTVVFPGNEVLIPDERAIERVEQEIGESDFILAVGSGVLQDLCKYVSKKSGIPYGVVATAPSMDGYASNGAAMILGGMKVTVSAGIPYAFLADTDVLKDAPLEMIKAGYGDIIGKYSALNDWRLSALVNGEYFCPYVYKLTEDMIGATLPLADKLLSRDGESVRVLMEALMVVGIAMSYVGNSRPASGSEHHLSHYFEITGIVKGREYFAHGIDVLYSTYVTSLVRQKLIDTPFVSEKLAQTVSEREEELKRVYGPVADGCIALQDKLGTYSRDLVPTYLVNESEIKAILAECPTPEVIAEIIKGIGLDLDEFYRFYGESHVADAIRYAKDLKDRYTVLWLYYDLFGTAKILK